MPDEDLMDSILLGTALIFGAVILVCRTLRRLLKSNRRRRPPRPPSSYRVVGRNKRGRPIYEHRQIAERVLKRKLAPGEVVHHINGIKDDNRVSNLCVMTVRDHEAYHEWQDRLVKKFGRYPKRATRIEKLKAHFAGLILDDAS